MQDPQKDRLYAWEDSFWEWGFQTLKLPRIRRWVKWACKKYGVEPPTVAGRVGRMSEYDPHLKRIRLVRCQQNLAITLHEVAHHIVWMKHGDTVEDHGRRFIGVYFWLIEESKLLPRSALYPSAKTAGLKWVRDLSPVRFSRAT